MSGVPTTARAGAGRQAAAWGVHLLTGSGAVIGMMSLNAIVDGRWVFAFLLMAVALVIDALDGTLARYFRVKEVLPRFDGALLDNMVDYFNFVIVPAFFLYAAGMVPEPFGWASAAAITLSSGYQFAHAEAKTSDFYFRGWPSYWNLLVFYLFMLEFSPVVNLGIVFFCAVLVFVPIHYVYPTRTPFFLRTTVVLSLIWSMMLAFILVSYPNNKLVLYLSLLFVVYYVGLSLYATVVVRPRALRGGDG